MGDLYQYIYRTLPTLVWKEAYQTNGVQVCVGDHVFTFSKYTVNMYYFIVL